MMKIISVIQAMLLFGFISFWENGSITVWGQQSNDSQNILVNGTGWKRQDAQAADPTWIIFNNKLYLWYEDQADQDPLNPPSLTLYICDPAPEYFTNGINITINAVSENRDRNKFRITGTRPQNEFVAVTCISGKVDSVVYPTSTTWECYVSDLVSGNNIIAATIRNGFTSTITVKGNQK